MLNTLIHFISFLIKLDKPHSQTSESERLLLATLARESNCLVEIGVFEGLVTRILAENSSDNSIVYGIDPFFRGRVGICWSLFIAKIYLNVYIQKDKIRLLRGLSPGSGHLVLGLVDFVFLDGDHSYVGLKDDWEYWSDRLVEGGIVALHDVFRVDSKPDSYHLGSFDFFEEVILLDDRFEFLFQRDSMAVLRKVKGII